MVDGSNKKGLSGKAALIAAGVIAGGALIGTQVANAATADQGTRTGISAAAYGESGAAGQGDTQGPAAGNADQSKPQRSDEQLLTGTTADKVKAAALAKYPGATVERVETDSEGVYEAHIVTTDGQRVIVQVGSDFAVTGTQSMQGGPGGGQRGGTSGSQGGSQGGEQGAPSGAPSAPAGAASATPSA